MKPFCIPRNTIQSDTIMVRTGIDSTRRSSNKHVTVEDGLKADRLFNVHCANRSPGSSFSFHIMQYLKDYQVGNLSFAVRAVQLSKGKCLVLNVSLGAAAAADESHPVC